MGPFEKSLLLYKAFLWSLLTSASSKCFFFLVLPTLPNWNFFTERLFAPSPAVSRSPLSHFSLRRLYLPLRVTLTHFAMSFYEQALDLPTSFPISVLARLRVKPRICRSTWRAFVSIHPFCFLLLLLGRFSLLVLPIPLGTCLPSFKIHTFLPMLSLRFPSLSRQGAALPHLDSLTSQSGDLDRWLCSFSFWQVRQSCLCQKEKEHCCLFGRPGLFRFF